VKGRPYRWVVLSVFVLSSAINYLDRQTLATVAPLVRAEFHLSNAQYGLILTVFSIAYAACAPFAGMLIDRIGLNRAISLAVGCGRAPVSSRGSRAGWAGCWGAAACWACRKRPAFRRRARPFIGTCCRRSAPWATREPGGREPGADSGAAGGHLDRHALRMAAGFRSHRLPGAALDSGVELDRASTARAATRRPL
jgi:hypothetical protein